MGLPGAAGVGGIVDMVSVADADAHVKDVRRFLLGEFNRVAANPNLLPEITDFAKRNTPDDVTLTAVTLRTQLGPNFTFRDAPTQHNSLHRTRPAEQCGAAFITTVEPQRLIAYAFKVTFATPKGKAAFTDGLETDSNSRADIVWTFNSPPPEHRTRQHVSELLVLGGARIEINVLLGKGDPAPFRAILDASTCAPENLQGCEKTMRALDDAMQTFVHKELPTDVNAVEAGTNPDWGEFGSYQTSSYSAAFL
jgi:hypothetical protein